jgi:hypothetical protein
VTRIRLKIELNPGGVGVRLDKLAKISTEVEKFIRLLAADAGAEPVPGDFVAKDFYDGSFGSVVEYAGNVDPAVADKFNGGLRFFADFKDPHQYINGEFSPATVRQFIELGTVIDADEVVKFGIIDGDAPSSDTEWKSITKITTLNVDSAYNQEYRYDGALQGRLGTWYKDSSYFNLRELTSGGLVKCFYPVEMYDQIYRLYEDKDAIVNLSGRIVMDRATGWINEVRVHWVKTYAPLSDSEFEKFFGLAPDLTGDLSTAEFIDKIRDDGSEDLH